MAKKLGLDLKAGDDVAIMIKGKVSNTDKDLLVDVEDVRGSMIDSAMLTDDGDKDYSKMARAFRLAGRKNERGSSDRPDGKGSDGQVADGGEDEQERDGEES